MQLTKVLDLDIYFSCWFFRISPPSIRECTLVKGFLSECTDYTKTLFNCTNVCYFGVCHLKGPPHIHLMSQTIVISSSVSWYHEQLVLQCSMNPNHTLAFATFWKPPNYFKFLTNHLSCVLPLVNIIWFKHLFVFWSHYNTSTGSRMYRKPRYKIKIFAPEVTDGGNSSLRSNFLKCWTTKRVG